MITVIFKALSQKVLTNFIGTVKFEVGEAELYHLPKGVDFAVKKMQRNEIARIACKRNMTLSEKAYEAVKLNPAVSF